MVITLFVLLLNLFWCCPLSATLSSFYEKPFVVVIPSYKNRDWFEKNLGSVLSQNYYNFRVVFIDDASPDGMGDLVKEYLQEKDRDHRVKFIRNKTRIGALGNVYKGIWLCKPYEIVVNLDGDDWLLDENVLKKLNDIYADPEVWVTYGQFIYYPCGSPGWAAEVPREIIEQNAFREYNWVTTAPRTFYAGLFHQIKKEDLMYNGEFFPMAGDLAYMWPILEMAGEHIRFIPDVLYVYNIATPGNDAQQNRERQFQLGLETRKKEKYLPIIKPY
ncbi:MAG: glycosyltransferase family 2 protein [Verrucomicrobia bacterium]|nr:glycosyltransferase family 2 protein [Verrucomicrobiota bacterium]